MYFNADETGNRNAILQFSILQMRIFHNEWMTKNESKTHDYLNLEMRKYKLRYYILLQMNLMSESESPCSNLVMKLYRFINQMLAILFFPYSEHTKVQKSACQLFCFTKP